jgi:hypothetical protein
MNSPPKSSRSPLPAIILYTGMAYTLDRFNVEHPDIKALLAKPIQYDQLALGCAR